MHRSPASPAALMVAALLTLTHVVTEARADDASDNLQAGRDALGRGDGPAAVSLLESALLAASAGDRPAVLGELRLAYQRAASQAEAAGDARRARSYRENLQIIDRPRGSAGVTPVGDGPTPAPKVPTPAGSPPTAPQGPDPLPAPSPPEPPALDAPASPPSDQPREGDDSTVRPPTDEAVAPASDIPGGTEPPGAPVVPAPAPIEEPESADPPSWAEVLRAADSKFLEQEYDEAGRIYEGLAARDQLPEAHRPVWAYCRFIAVARKINSQPSSPEEWASIHAEIREIRALTPPEIWFSEYLRRLAAERSGVAGARPSGFIVRGQSDSEGPAGVIESAAEVGSWKVMETENFRIFHADAELADGIARSAERSRTELLRYWDGSEADAPWSPRCDLYVYPDATIFTRMTGQEGDSPGFSTMGLSGGRVVARRINLRADHGDLVESVVPHEVAHVVLADLFPTRQIPRWADEGIAVLAEPNGAQAGRLAVLDGPIASGKVFLTGQLMTASMPDGRYWDLFMAQSASLARYLIQLDSPGRLVAYLRETHNIGAEAALRKVYGFEDFDDLHARWLSHSRREATASASPGGIASRSGEAVRVQ
ncbi:peptidase MA family metallohydrolase [Tautonia plasticadhaerens]|uniref:Peptidase MA-like domain-containing protein n=1 Tax=Tautonia plasticadhaerens TaxID=2527974 RepID=A0A518GXD6_9BACT|nr:hypothetical protein [Tautonia plasticadhaerens]QDV33264.1 hypothetical protein ElP_11070 [Tautonia plasticadhaerens]